MKNVHVKPARSRAKTILQHLSAIGLLSLLLLPDLSAQVTFNSPGFAPSRMDDLGRLVTDWGTVSLDLSGAGLSEAVPAMVKSVKLDGNIPAAQALSRRGPVTLTATAYRAPAWPSGFDVLTVRIEETAGEDRTVNLTLGLPDTVRIGLNTVSLGGRAVLKLPAGPRVSQTMREWGWADDATALPGWARPAVECDPAFRNIRAGLGGVPILYHFKVAPRTKCKVVLGFCESHWDQAGQRPVVCQVEGAANQEVDPLVRWGQHHPGVVLFEAADANGDGNLDVDVLPKTGAPDQNPILNAIWIFPSETTPNLDQVILGRLNSHALRYVSVGGENDQSLYSGGRVEYAVKLSPRAVHEMTFLLASPGGSVPQSEQSAWTPEQLRKAAADVWRDWR